MRAKVDEMVKLMEDKLLIKKVTDALEGLTPRSAVPDYDELTKILQRQKGIAPYPSPLPMDQSPMVKS